MWSYWDTGFENAELFTQLCLENQRRAAEASGWEYRLLSMDTIGEYLDMEVFQQNYERLELKYPPHVADLIRLMLLKKYGGLWMDASSYLARDLSWVDDPKKEKLLHNKIRDYPDVVLGAFSQGKSVYLERGESYDPDRSDPYLQEGITYMHDPDLNMVVHVFPGYENWFLMAKANSTYFNDWWDFFQTMQEMGGKGEMDKVLRE